MEIKKLKKNFLKNIKPVINLNSKYGNKNIYKKILNGNRIYTV